MAALATFWLASCSGGPRKLAIEDADYWREEGFVQMVPPLRLPGRGGGRDRTEVWLRLPQGGMLTTRWLEAQQRYVMDYPSGTIADRVEYWAWGKDRDMWSVADVRGTHWLDGAEYFRALRPNERKAKAPLRGFEWKRDDAGDHQRATDALLEMTAALASDEERSATLARARRNYDCAGCHQHAREDNRKPREHGLTNRGTDARGFVLIQTVLSDRAPIETYFPADPNLQDPLVRYICPADQPVQRDAEGRPQCPAGDVPIGIFDIAGGLKVGGEHAQQVCASRRYLFDHLDQSGRELFQESFGACGIAE